MTAGRSLSGTPALAGRATLQSPADAATGLMATGAAALGMAVAAAGATLLIRRLSGGYTAVPSAAVPWAVAVAGIPLVLAVEAAARLAGDRRPAGLARGGGESQTAGHAQMQQQQAVVEVQQQIFAPAAHSVHPLPVQAGGATPQRPTQRLAQTDRLNSRAGNRRRKAQAGHFNFG